MSHFKYSLKEDLTKYIRSKKTSYKRNINFEKFSDKNASTRLTSAEDDLLFCLLHDNRVASPLAQIFDPTWLNLNIPAGRVLAKIMAEIKADGPVEPKRMKHSLKMTAKEMFFIKIFFKKFLHLMIILSCNTQTSVYSPFLLDLLNKRKNKYWMICKK